MNRKYDETNKESIFQYAQKLKGQTFNEVCDQDKVFLQPDQDPLIYKEEYKNKKRKGGLGEIIEERYFHYKIDNEARADFPKAELELKVTPYKINKNKTLSAKERLSISMIDYMKIIDTDFYDSNAWEKIKNILLIYYHADSEIQDRLNYIVDYIYLYSPSEADLKIILHDYDTIQKKVLDGKAHELSEGDTIYLGAATKSSSSKQRTSQPCSSELAKPRAFSLKNSYMTYLLRNEIVPQAGQEEQQDKVIQDSDVTDFEAYVLGKINEYKGCRSGDLFKRFLAGEYKDSYSDYSRIAYAILGVRTENAEEFEKASIVVKAIRIDVDNRGRNKIVESMSFPAFEIKELVEEEWETSETRQYFEETKFLFVLYQQDEDGYYLSGALFWNMPVSEIDGDLQKEWTRARDTFKRGVKFRLKEQKNGIFVHNDLPKGSNTNILHVRPHTGKSAYLIRELNYTKGNIERHGDQLPNGDFMTIQSFWLNNHYIFKQVKDYLSRS
ncbi:Sau3AI family type II restriction endonuclease [Sporosarcina sp. G11-34]|uniref:Sau3AI family type II restriction endonuclease n=1 Tax=Sporosarcina sp. G11-34 TaxID=2849605 RepID=UPI0022A9A045|nr:Sau3AI family type II restriction endonuclease [Sporosarcina sp. G11-34]MCZ2259143.1 restriction endonuclease [Sporosarcina sp. G11-34]